MGARGLFPLGPFLRRVADCHPQRNGGIRRPIILGGMALQALVKLVLIADTVVFDIGNTAFPFREQGGDFHCLFIRERPRCIHHQKAGLFLARSPLSAASPAPNKTPSVDSTSSRRVSVVMGGSQSSRPLMISSTWSLTVSEISPSIHSFLQSRSILPCGMSHFVPGLPVLFQCIHAIILLLHWLPGR